VLLFTVTLYFTQPFISVARATVINLPFSVWYVNIRGLKIRINLKN